MKILAALKRLYAWFDRMVAAETAKTTEEIHWWSIK